MILHLSRSYKHETMGSKSSIPYSLTRNSFNRTTFAGHSKISSHKTHTKAGIPTLLGFKRGFIQASPHFPETKTYLCWSTEQESLVIRGYDAAGKSVFKTYAKIGTARAALKTIK